MDFSVSGVVRDVVGDVAGGVCGGPGPFFLPQALAMGFTCEESLARVFTLRGALRDVGSFFFFATESGL